MCKGFLGDEPQLISNYYESKHLFFLPRFAMCCAYSACVDVIRANRSDTIMIPFLSPACLSSPNDCNVWGSGMSGDIWYLMSSALLPLLSLASASAIVWVPPRPIDCLGLGMRGDMLSTGMTQKTQISQWHRSCMVVNLYICVDFCAWYLMVRSTLKYEWITCKGWIFHHTFELLPTSHLKVHLIVHAANLASEKNLGKNELLVVPPMQRMNLLAPYIWVSTHLANIQTARWKLSHSITQINSKAEISR